jgi:hypothetical protein
MIDKKIQFSLMILSSLAVFLIIVQFWSNGRSSEMPSVSHVALSMPQGDQRYYKTEIPERKEVRPSLVDQIEEYETSEQKAGLTDAYDDMEAYVVNNDLESKVVLRRGGKEIVLEESIGEGYDRFSYSNPKFSPKGSYLSYEAQGYEIRFIKIFSTQTSKEMKIPDMYSDFKFSHTLFFTPDEQYVAACASAGFGGEFGGWVFSLPNYSNSFNLVDYFNEYNQIDCSLTKDAIVFSAREYRNSNLGRRFRFSLATQKVEFESLN